MDQFNHTVLWGVPLRTTNLLKFFVSAEMMQAIQWFTVCSKHGVFNAEAVGGFYCKLFTKVKINFPVSPIGPVCVLVYLKEIALCL